MKKTQIAELMKEMWIVSALSQVYPIIIVWLIQVTWAFDHILNYNSTNQNFFAYPHSRVFSRVGLLLSSLDNLF